EVDAVCAHAAKAPLDALDHVLAVVAARVRVLAIAGQRVLGGEHDALAAVAEQLAKESLRLAVGVVARSVDEVAASVEEKVEHAARLFERSTPAPFLTERHRPEGQLAHTHRRPAEQPVLHRDQATSVKLANEVRKFLN